MKIQRFRGDTYPETLVLREDSLPVDLNTISVVQLAIRKPLGTVVVDGVKDSNAATGIVTFTFTEEQVADLGVFYYDVQVVGTDTTKATFVRDRISFEDDINKN